MRAGEWRDEVRVEMPELVCRRVIGGAARDGGDLVIEARADVVPRFTLSTSDDPGEAGRLRRLTQAGQDALGDLHQEAIGWLERGADWPKSEDFGGAQ